MPSERVQRQIDALLDEAEAGIKQRDWTAVREAAEAVLRVDPENADALSYLAIAGDPVAAPAQDVNPVVPRVGSGSETRQPTSFCEGRYVVRRFLGEGGKKLVYLATDSLLDREVAFALIKTDGLDEVGRERVRREARAMGRLGAHPHVVSVFDLGEHEGQPFIVTELMGGGDVEGLIEKAEQHRLPLGDAIRIADEICQGLEFAHSKDVVHRDLKPGNVWLTSSGTVKLGDFGLAVSLDRTRLTQAGMMVGTVSYMPPEQALGGEVTPRSDLYSLGAMLYELATGRPPFIGDESVAIVTQHLNTPPVAPSWHNPDLPPGLETLILRLLEKDPGKRPTSAADVRVALAGVNISPPLGGAPQDSSAAGGVAGTQGFAMTPPPPSGEGDGGRGTSPLYRRIFVGREAELRQLQTAFDNALSGQGSLLAVVGEPGIGKTALSEQLATYAAMRGGRALVGHCYEEGSLSLPYLAFIEAMRSYVLERDPAGLAQDLGTGAAEIARLVSEVRQRVGIEPAPGGSEPEEERWRLYQAVVGFLRNASLVQPLLIILEDLHWADRGTLDLLLHLTRQLGGARLLVVGTYRDIEVDRSHPLAGALAELRRSSGFARVALRGLHTPEVQRMLAGIAGQEVPISLAEAVFRQTEGNPLFVQEVARYLVEEGLLTGGRAAGGNRSLDATAIAMSLPEGLREVIGKRLSRLSADSNRVLAIGAVMGREFALATLRSVSPLAEEALVEALDEAVRVGVLEEEARIGQVRYRFAHAYFRQTLYEELSAPRRIQLHQQVARALEQQYAGRPEEHAAELAEHFAHSSDRDDLAKAVGYGERAAQRAIAVNAYGEAARHLERALEVQEVLDPNDPAKRCDLLLAFGEALSPAGEPQRVFEVVIPEAYALAEGLADPERLSRACQLALQALERYGGTVTYRTADYRTWAERADRHARPGTADRVLADLALSGFYMGGEEFGRADALNVRALETARAIGDPQTLWRAANRMLSGTWRPEQFHDRVRLAREFGAWPANGVTGDYYGVTLWLSSQYLLAGGDREAMERVAERLKEVVAQNREPRNLLGSLTLEIVLSTLAGDLEGAIAGGERLAAQGEELGSPVFGLIQVARYTWPVYVYLGQPERAVRAYDALFELSGMRSAGEAQRRELCALEVGPDPRAVAALETALEPIRSAGLEDLSTGRMTGLLAVAVAVGDREVAARLVPRLRSMAGVAFGLYGNVPAVGRLLGSAAAMLGDLAQAREFYEAAREATARIRHRPEHALVRLDLAEQLLKGSAEERSEALGHLDFAIEEFRAMKMQPALERALRHKGLLQA